jgi:hypothetical protein
MAATTAARKRWVSTASRGWARGAGAADGNGREGVNRFVFFAVQLGVLAKFAQYLRTFTT